MDLGFSAWARKALSPISKPESELQDIRRDLALEFDTLWEDMGNGEEQQGDRLERSSSESGDEEQRDVLEPPFPVDDSMSKPEAILFNGTGDVAMWVSTMNMMFALNHDGKTDVQKFGLGASNLREHGVTFYHSYTGEKTWSEFSAALVVAFASQGQLQIWGEVMAFSQKGRTIGDYTKAAMALFASVSPVMVKEDRLRCYLRGLDEPYAALWTAVPLTASVVDAQAILIAKAPAQPRLAAT